MAAEQQVVAAREVGLAFGSNMGDKVGHIEAALRALQAMAGFDLTAVSKAYRTPPWGYEDQDPFVNACAIANTSLAPHILLERAKDAERQIGRTSTFRWGPRVIDIDVIYMEGVLLQTEQLTLPHPEALNRAFVLRPLMDMKPDLALSGRRIDEALAMLDEAGIEPLDICLYPEGEASFGNNKSSGVL